MLCSWCGLIFFFFKQKTAYEMRISDWSSDVCSSDLAAAGLGRAVDQDAPLAHLLDIVAMPWQALVDHVEIGVGAVLETDAVGAQPVHRREDVVGGERKVLEDRKSVV